MIGQKSFGTKLNRPIVEINFVAFKPAIMAFHPPLLNHCKPLFGRGLKAEKQFLETTLHGKLVTKGGC
jgi:hypothetical protein